METKVRITSDNVHVFGAYLKAAKELNRFVKDTFSREEQKELSIAGILPVFHSENDEIEHALNAYLKANPDEFLRKGMTLTGNLSTWKRSDCHYRVIERISEKRYMVECVEIAHYPSDKGDPVSFSVFESDMFSVDLSRGILDGHVRECPEEEYFKVREIAMQARELYNQLEIKKENDKD